MKVRYTPAELIEALRDLSAQGYADTFPDIPEEDVIEADAADFIEAALSLLTGIADGDSELAARARAVINRQE